jgi:hypothetical protein
MTEWKYTLECGHILVFHREVKLKEEKRWCKRCHELRKVVKVKVEKFIQKKLKETQPKEKKEVKG